MSLSARKITDDYDGYETQYPELLEISNRQLEKQMWFASHTRVEEEDALEMKYQLTQKQQEVLKAILSMFRKYEINVSDFWTDVYPKYFKSTECKEGAAVINMMERAVHARFYDKINKVFGMDTDVFYLSYLDDPIFKDRAKWLGETLNNPDKHLVCLVYGLVEGVSLFSMFALIRSFQARGINKIATTVKGTKQSSLDELLHSEFLAKSFGYLYGEIGKTLEDDSDYYEKLLEQTYNVVNNEIFILESLIGKDGTFNNVHIDEYILLVKKLADLYFSRLGCVKLPYNVGESDLYSWFITQSLAYAEPDFFGKGMGKEYETAWNVDGFGKCWEGV